MMCFYCKEKIEMGEACILDSSQIPCYNHFFHPSCYFQHKEEKREKALAHSTYNMVKH